MRRALAVAALLCLAMPGHAAPAATGQGFAAGTEPATVRTVAYRINRGGLTASGAWHYATLPLFLPLFRLTEARAPISMLEADVVFDGNRWGAAPLALLTEDVHDRLQVLVNGKEVFRDFATPDDPVIDVHKPVLVALPAGAVHPGANDLRIVVLSKANLGLAPIEIGPQDRLETAYNTAYIMKLDMPRKTSFTMLVMSYAAILFWIFKRSEKIYLLFAVMTYIWACGNTNYIISLGVFGEHTAFVIAALGLVSAQMLNFLFCALYLGIRRWRVCCAAVGAAAIGFVAIIKILALPLGDESIAHLLGTMLMGGSAVMTGLVWARTRTWDSLMLALLLSILTVGCVHDLGRMPEWRMWSGLGFDVQPFNGFVVSMAFLATFGQRTLSALRQVEQANRELEGKVRAALSDLAISEEKRRALEVTRALEQERERLLREMHDGIGSNLVVALRVAEQQQQPPETLNTLRQALADLRITVDSLEPLEGDLIALLGNLRHRLERDLTAAGVRCRWNVGDCPALPWLDATNALHVLRIFQEAIGNSLHHAGARVIEIGCFPESRHGRAGISAWLRDDGTGFDPARAAGGKGLRNMVSRAKSLAGELVCESAPGNGTRIALWLPLVRG